ncbi:MAG TPA: biopolymer transporter ExbD [Pyrinomonadaceae bacterium]|jgi:biopolymer transport protein ExbD|nr:biopolymer transporter ExbD [Pyrinomonadaceae bacterium]
MGMSSGGSSGGAVPNINVTPLIDVLLVLLIIFMVITPSKPSRFEAKVPAEPKDEEKNVILKPNPNTLIVFINREGAKLRLNQDDIGDVSDTTPLTAKLEEVFKDRESRGVLREGTNEVEKTIFIKAPKSVKYGDVVKVIDAVKLAGAQPIGLQIDDLEQ